MFRRRPEIDPETARLIERRLENLLIEPPEREQTPRRRWPEDVAAPPQRAAEDGLDSSPAPRPARRWAPMLLSRTHLGLVAVLALLALLGAGWVVVRARPVALATPIPATSPTSPTDAARPSAAGSSPSPAPKASNGPVRIVVHVVGAVRRPGLVTLTDRARVDDAIKAAGGLRRDADPGQLNLAQLVSDGEQIVIGTRGRPAGEVRGDDPAAPAAPGAAGGGSGAAPTLDLNRATQIQLESLPGVGPVTATKILAWRQEHGRFTRVEELQEVSGIGPKTYAEIAPHCRV